MSVQDEKKSSRTSGVKSSAASRSRKKGKAFALAATAAALVCAFSLSMSDYRKAFADPTWNPHCCGETLLLGSIEELMIAQDMAIYEYMIAGVGDVGTGIVGTISGNSTGQSSHAENSTANNDAHLRQQIQKLESSLAVAKRVVNQIPDERDCDEIPFIQGAAAGVGAAMAAGRGAAVKIDSGVSKILKTTPSAAAHAGGYLKTHNQYCTAEEAARGVICTSASTMPDGDSRVQSVFAPAHDFTKPALAAKQSLTFSDPKETQAAVDSIANISGRFSPPTLPAKLNDTPAGRMYATKTKFLEARLSPSVAVLSGIAARRQAPDTLPAGAQSAWDSVSGRYTTLFPGASAAPTAPSEAEQLRFEVMRRYADAGAGSWYQERIAKTNGLHSMFKEQAVSGAVETKLLYEIHARLEEDNAVNAAILAQMINPVDGADVSASAQNAYKNVK